MYQRDMAIYDSPAKEGVFLDQSHDIWSQAMGDPKAAPSEKEAHPYTEKLHGEYSWPFKFAIPRHVSGKTSTGDTTTFNLPATFGEKNAQIGINYEVHVHIRKSALHIDAE